ncbi:ShlB/FhaC/HecB family hemolysin secretion/activation protein [Bradyrhizobium sp. 200]|uniref:ShlB/FhaC/HecB family hemolysin secretion/activation protein n=1 Tax=Bradyrhizobium sp. 200 TaxID=2782665 RepID=UPI001FFFFC4C|nr:ShlB/FhaC/HecB family hemolysin secretion/activation protein [Bradyrhizobium sp. 200]
MSTASVALWTVIVCLPAQAQHANQPGYDPRQTEKRFEDQQEGQPSAARSRLPMPALARPEVQGDSKPLFVLQRVSIRGAAAIPLERLVTAYQPYVGKKVSQADLAAIAAAVSEVYRAAGFHLSRAIVPPQDIQSGQLHVQVIEGSITELTLKGEGGEQFGVRPMLDAVLAEQPSRLATLERQLLLINGRPGVRIEDTAIEEIGTASGHFRLIVSLKTWHVFMSFGIDNLGSLSVGPWQSYGTAAFNSYLAPGDSLVLNLSTTPGDPRQLAFGRLSYDVPVGTDGARIGASGYYSEVWPGDYRRLYSDNIKTESFEIRGGIAALQSQKSSLTLTAAAGFTNASEKDVFGLIYADRIRTASLTSDYRLQDNFGGTNYLTVNYRQGLDILGASHRDDDYLSRDGASGKFSALNFWFTRYQTLTDAWSLKLASAGQVASGPLFTSQQFYLGGIAFGRGYGSAEISGDNGLAGSVELRFDQKTNLQYLSGYQIYGFLDSGVAWNDGYRPSDGLSLTSAGGGVRFFLADGLQADIGVAAPLTYRAPDNPTRGARVLFSLSSALKLCPVRAATRCL